MSKVAPIPGPRSPQTGAGSPGTSGETKVPTPRDVNPGPPSFAQRTIRILDDKYFVSAMTLATIYALFADDIRLCVCPISADNFFFGISCIVLAMFFSELCMNCIARPGYAPHCQPTLAAWARFYFWLDLIATVSIIPDIGWLWDLITGGGDTSENGAIKSARASRAAAKAGRVVRLVRLVRLVKLYKMHNKNNDDDGGAIGQSAVRHEPSKVGNKLSDLTMRRLIVLILTVIVVLPLFDGGLDADSGLKYQQDGLDGLHYINALAYSDVQTWESDAEREAFLKANVLEYVRTSGMLVHMKIHNLDPATLNLWIDGIKFQAQDCETCEYTTTTNPEIEWNPSAFIPNYDDIASNFRTSELNLAGATGCFADGQKNYESEDCSSLAIFDIKNDTTLEAGFNMLKTFFVMFMMALGAIMFQQDAQLLVIGPIERMMDMVRRLAEDPMGATQTDDDMLDEDRRAKKQGYETALLESTLTKVGALLQVGFGAAGAEIIAANMSGGAEINPMVPGKMITSIYGFCDIRQFTDTTECLQEEVMVYVNKLGDIVHGCTHNYYGMANKNIGDAFLLTWKVCNGNLAGFTNFKDAPNEDLRQKANANTLCPANMGAGRRNRRITPTEMADSALTAFLKAYINLDNANSHGTLTEYLTHKRVVARFGPNFRIKMGFGMHVGWAIEGAIGSPYKIDATYLSPQVEMSDRLEAGSKIFMTPLNLSHWFVALLSPGARRFLRPIDRIMVGGCPTAMTVYTYDVLNFKEDFGTPKFKTNGQQLAVDFENDPQYVEIQNGLHPKFKDTFNQGFQEYLAGNWAEAKVILESADKLMVESGKADGDGPTHQLLGFMGSTNFVKPSDWTGFHNLDGY